MFDVDAHDARILRQRSTITTFDQWRRPPTTTATASMRPHHPQMAMTTNTGCWRPLVSPTHSTSDRRGVGNVRYRSNHKGRWAPITSIDNAGEKLSPPSHSHNDTHSPGATSPIAMWQPNDEQRPTGCSSSSEWYNTRTGRRWHGTTSTDSDDVTTTWKRDDDDDGYRSASHLVDTMKPNSTLLLQHGMQTNVYHDSHYRPVGVSHGQKTPLPRSTSIPNLRASPCAPAAPSSLPHPQSTPLP